MESSEQTVATLVEGSEKLTSIFGYWPTFHDAEVLDVHLWRGDVKPEEKRYLFPVLTTKLHVWELTNEVTAQGYCTLRKHTLATLRFYDVLDLRMEGFNQQNAILELSIARNQHSEGPVGTFIVNFDPAFGMGAEFTCSRIEVVEAIPCSDDGRPMTSAKPQRLRPVIK
jgi:hypothetical protein